MATPVLTEEKIFYDFTLRGNPQGSIQGASVTFYNVIKRDGEIISANPDQQMAVTLGIEQGAPIEDILGPINTSLLVERENLLAHIQNLEQANETLNAKVAEVEKQRDEVSAKIEESVKAEK